LLLLRLWWVGLIEEWFEIVGRLKAWLCYFMRPLGARHPCLFSKSIPALRPTFLLQPKKAGKKGRSLQKFLTAQNKPFVLKL
jgi:hypothetical protein